MSTDPRQKAATREQSSGQISYLRCVVTQWDEQRIMATSSHGAVIIRITDKTLPALLTTGKEQQACHCSADRKQLVFHILNFNTIPFLFFSFPGTVTVVLSPTVTAFCVFFVPKRVTLPTGLLPVQVMTSGTPVWSLAGMMA